MNSYSKPTPELAEELVKLHKNIEDKTNQKSQLERDIQSLKTKAEGIKLKLGEYVGANIQLKNIVVGTNLVRVQWFRAKTEIDGGFGKDYTTVTIEDIL